MDILENVPLDSYSTFRIGGNAKYFVVVKNIKDISEAYKFANSKNLKVFILGGGSNILFSDSGFDGLVIKINLTGISYEDKNDFILVKVKSGESWDSLVAEVVSKGLYGLENLSLIPGTVGASPVQNIGAYGKEAKDVIECVEVFDTKSNSSKIISNKECDFGYRTSIFKNPKFKNLLITEVVFKLKKKGEVDINYKDLKDYFSAKQINPTLQDVREAVIAIRLSKMPSLDKVGTAGSFWKNPIISKEHAFKLKKQYPLLPVFELSSGKSKIPLAWILDNVLNLKGYFENGIGLYKNQPLVVVAEQPSNAKDVDLFVKNVEKKVFDAVGIILEKEVEYVGWGM